MNDRRAYYYPVLINLALLLLVWVGAFFADVTQMLSGEALSSSSLISAEGMRWALRTAVPSINALPWGRVMMRGAIAGLLRGSGLARVVGRLFCLRRPTALELRALLFSLAVAICYVVLLYMSSVSPWNLLGGVTEDPALSPLLQGWALLLFVGVLIVSLIYGFIYGSYRSVMDTVASTAATFGLFVPAFMALIPASGIIPCLQYAGVGSIHGISWSTVSAILYLLPFVYVAVLKMLKK